MDLNEMIGGVKLVSEVLSAERPSAEKLKAVTKAVALGYCKLLPRINPSLKDKPLNEQFAYCGMAAYATVGIARQAYQVCAEKITVDEAAEKVADVLKVAIASVPKVLPLIANIHPVFKTVAIAIAPVCEKYAPTMAEKLKPCLKRVIVTAKTRVMNFAKSFVQNKLLSIATRLFA